MNRFTGKRVLVTGAASGIGRGIAQRFSDEGANLVVCDVDNTALRDTAALWPQDRTLAKVCDVADYEQVQGLIAVALARFGGLDVLVNNAGVAPAGTVEEVSLADWHRAIAVDLTGVFHGCRAAMPRPPRRAGELGVPVADPQWNDAGHARRCAADGEVHGAAALAASGRAGRHSRRGGLPGQR